MMMTPSPMPLDSLAGAFLLTFSALFSIVNPIGSSLIFSQVTAERSRIERVVLARKVAVYAAAILLVSLWVGGYILAFFGITLGALRMAGGLVVTASAWNLLRNPKEREAQKAEHAAGAQGQSEDVAFFPLTMPFTTGAGSIAVTVALASQRPTSTIGALSFMGGASAAAITIAACVWMAYSWSDRLVALLGQGGARIVSRLVAFLLLCVGVQIMSTGFASLATTILHPAAS